MSFKYFHVLPAFLLFNIIFAQTEINYSEDSIAPYTLPNLLLLNNRKRVKKIRHWEKRKRPEILKAFENQVYGKIPEIKLNPSFTEIVEESDSALDNTTIRKQVQLVFEKHKRKLTINILLYLPKGIQSPPVFVGYNFYGNQTTTSDENVILSESWVPNKADFGIMENRATENSRGVRSHRWPIKKIINKGFGIATVYCGEIDPDRNNFEDGIHPFFYNDNQNRPNNDEWGTISAWAWGMSRVLDYLKQHKGLGNSEFISFGHSRLGKTSLWAGALDERFALIIANNSGCGGAAIFRRKIGETAAIINGKFPHWFSVNFKKYNNAEHLLPVDQHMLIALIAPRPVYISSAAEDIWADPRGEYLSGYYASPVYELYGKKGLAKPELPQLNSPIHNDIGYHIRQGKHDVTEYDWVQFMKFANKHLKN